MLKRLIAGLLIILFPAILFAGDPSPTAYRVVNGRFIVVHPKASPSPEPQSTYINSRGLRIDSAGTLYAIAAASATPPTLTNSILGVTMDANGYLVVSITGASGTSLTFGSTTQNLGATPATAAGQCLVSTGSGTYTWVAGSCAGSASANWSAIVADAPNTQTLQVGTAGSLSPTGTGVIYANKTLLKPSVTGGALFNLGAAGVAPTSPNEADAWWLAASHVFQWYDGTSTNTAARIQSAPTSGHLAAFSGTTGLLVDGGAVPSTATTVNSQTCTLGSTCTIPFQTNSASNTSQAGVNFLTSTTNAVGLTVTPVNSATNAMKFEVTGTAATATDLAAYTSYSVFGSGNSAKAWITPGGNNYVLMSPATNYATTTPGFVSPTNARIGLFPSASEVGDLVYCASFAGSACTSWAILPGNTGGTTAWLQETTSGVPSWTSPPGSGTVTYSSSVAGYIPKWGTVPNLVDSLLDDGISTASTLTYAGTGGITSAGGFKSTSAGGVAGAVSLTQGTAPSLPANSFTIFTPTGISTAYGWSVPAAENASAGFVKAAAASSHVSALTIGTIDTSDLPGSGATTVNGQTCTLNSTCAVESATSGQVAISGGSSAALTGAADLTWATHTLTLGASGIFDMSAASATAGHKLPSAAGAAPTTAAIFSYDSTTNAPVYGNGTTTKTVVGAATSTTATQALFATATAGAPAFRAIATGDLPTITIALGGTNATSAGGAGMVPNTSSTTASAWTATPTLGVDNSVAGTLSLSSTAGAAHTTFSSSATTSNTFAFPAAVPTTLHHLGCTTASTTCTVTDMGTATQYNVLIGGASGALANVAPSATSGVPLISQGSSANPVFGTAVVAGGGTGATSFTAYAPVVGGTTTTGALQSTAVGTAKQMLVSGGSGAVPNYIDFPDVKVVPAANCNNATAGAGWSVNSSFTATCRGGSNNLNGVLNGTPSAGTAVAYFDVEVPGDWDTAVKPYIKIDYASGSNTSGTVIWTVSTACTKEDGSITDDPAWIAESAMGTQTMAAANRMWGQSAQIAGAMTNCVAGSTIYFKLALSGTASSAIQVSKAVLTIPRLLTVQAN